MFKKHGPLLFLALSLVCIKLSTDATSSLVNTETLPLELSGLKIKLPKRQPAKTNQVLKPISSVALLTVKEKKKSCNPLDVNKIKSLFMTRHKEELKNKLGPWYIEKAEDLKSDYGFFNKMSNSALYSSGLYSLQKSFEIKKKPSEDFFIPVHIFYNLYYRDRSNSDAIFYIYARNRRAKLDASAFNYLKKILKETSVHKPLNFTTHKEVYKLATDPESLLGAFEVLKGFKGLSTNDYKATILELDQEARIALSKNLIKSGAEKTTINKHLDWSPAAYQAAYSLLKEEDMARAYSPLEEILKEKSESNRSFVDKLTLVETDCDLEEAWNIATSVIREL